jgi:heme-degrading monooxygenase HmoA
MIARIWHGKTLASKGEDYKQFTMDAAIPDYQSIPGCLSLNFLYRVENDIAHFTLITYWDSIDSIKMFAGADYHKAKYYPEDKNFLLEFEEEVAHHEVFYSSNNKI